MRALSKIISLWAALLAGLIVPAALGQPRVVDAFDYRFGSPGALEPVVG